MFGMISDGEREEGEKKEKIILKVFEEMNWKLKWYKRQVDMKSKLSDSDSDYDSNIETDYDSSRH